ncbi:tetratricopeptide repeat protein [Patescibacteria group bacterium]|nr:tetratricopeptide repeat protein [Patescibacteria group bacterium]MBU1922157.1 tetratricopeptide repeat protein [Patescibacteria group bacterium]
MPNSFSPAAQAPSSVASDKPFSSQAKASGDAGKKKLAGQKHSHDFGIVKFCDFVIRWSIYLAVFLVPMMFLPFTQDVLELNKQIVLVFLSFIALMAWIGRMMALRQVEFKRTIINLLVLLYLVAYGVISWFSLDRYQSFVGTNGLEQFSFITVLSFVIMYFVIVNNVRELKFVRNLLYAFLGSGALVAFYGLLQILGGFALPWDFTKVVTFNSVGTVFGLGVYLGFGLLLIGGLLLVMTANSVVFCPRGKWGIITKVLLCLAALLDLIVLIILDFWIIWVLLIVGTVLLLAFAIVKANEFKPGASFMLPMLTLVIAILLLVINLPIDFNLPAEVSPSSRASLEIARSALQESPLVGSGPGTFILDYAKYHSGGVNLTPFWGVRFDRANAHVLTLLATTGLVGVLFWLVLVVGVLIRMILGLIKDQRAEIWRYILALGSVFVVMLVSKFIYSSNIATEFASWIVIALVAAFASRHWYKVEFKVSPRASLLMSFVFILLIVATVSVFYLAGQRYAAEVVYAQAVKIDQERGSVDNVIAKLNKAARLNQYETPYLRNLSQAILFKINQEVGAEITEEKGSQIQTLINDMLVVARAAIDAGPANVVNYTNAAYIYQQIILLVQNADQWAAETYGQAIELEPTNPVAHTELGKVYIVMADREWQLTQAEDQAAAAEAKTKYQELLTKAEQVLVKAIELKADYAPAHYQLALVYDRQGRLDDAIAKMEQVAASNTEDVGVAFQLGLLYLRNEDNDKAQNAFEWAISLAPSYSNALWFLATVYENQGEVDKAIEQVEKVLELNPDNTNVEQRLNNLKEYGTSQPPAIPEPVEQAPGGQMTNAERATETPEEAAE